jgi:hypothetical protein
MFARGRSYEDRSYLDGEVRVKKDWIFKFLAMEALKSQS